MAASWKDGISLKLVNVLVYFLFLGSNIYTVASPDSIYFNRKETYFTPASWVFLVWPVIHFLLLGAVVYQFFPSGKKIMIDHISWHFPLLGILSAAYINLWAMNHYIVAVVVMHFIIVFANLINIAKKDHISKSWGDLVFIQFPFSLYLGWANVLVLVTGFEAFGVDRLHQHAGTWTKVIVFFCLFSLHLTTDEYAPATGLGNLPASAAICWSLWAICVHQTSSGFVHTSSLVFAILSLIRVVLSGIYQLLVWRGFITVNEESASLLPASEQAQPISGDRVPNENVV